MPIPVPAPAITSQLDRVASFRPGFWNGRYYAPEFVKALYDNFKKFSEPDKSGQSYYTPYLSLSHQDDLRFGRIRKADYKDGVLWLWADQMPLPVAQWVNAHMLAERSIEFIEPKMIDGVLKGFTGPDGQVVQTPVLKCLSLLGNDLPAVKGLPPLPTATFSQLNTGGTVLKFSTRSISFNVRRFAQMNQQLLQQLQSLGFDVSTLPQGTPDNVLQAIIDVCQKVAGGVQGQATNANNMAGNAATGTTGRMADGTIQVPSVMPNNTQGYNGMPTDVTSLTLKFNEMVKSALATSLAPINADLANMRKQNEAEAEQRKKNAERERDGIVSRFFDRMGTEGRISPDMRKPLEMAAKALEFTTVRKFADGKADGTALDEYLKGIEDSHPVVRKMSGTPNGSSAVRKPPVEQQGGSGNRTEVMDRVLQATPMGRKVLAQRQAAAKQ